MSANDGSVQAAPVGEPVRPQNIVERSARAFLIAPLIQNVVLWLVYGTWIFVGSGGRVMPVFDRGFWWFAAGVLFVSYFVASTIGVLVHVICVKLGMWRLWHYLLAGVLGGATLTVVWSLILPGKPSDSGMTLTAVFFIPSAVVMAGVVWLFVFWRNPPAHSTADLDALS